MSKKENMFNYPIKGNIGHYIGTESNKNAYKIDLEAEFQFFKSHKNALSPINIFGINGKIKNI